MTGADVTADTPRLILGGLAVDDRGELVFFNEFTFVGIKRYYLVSNHRQGFVRAWHAHRREAKYVTVVHGAALIGAVAIDNWERPSRDAHVDRWVLSAHKPSLLYIPAGYANGFMSLSADAKLLFYSTSNLEESKDDDMRYDARHWDIWQVVER